MSEDYYTILQIPKTARPDEIKKAYLKLARDNHPDRFTDPEERLEADRRFQAITEAYNQLRDEKLRHEYDKSLQKQTRTPEEEARLYYKNGELREQSRDFENALRFYYEAMRLKPDELEYVLAAGRVLMMDKSKYRQAADLYTRAMETHPDAPEPHVELGGVYSKSGMLSRAKRVYEGALAKWPHHPELKRRLAEVTSAIAKSRPR
jgi:curved DNA-binding protein CbpA